jgi:hypothetical protein
MCEINTARRTLISCYLLGRPGKMGAWWERMESVGIKVLLRDYNVRWVLPYYIFPRKEFLECRYLLYCQSIPAFGDISIGKYPRKSEM